MKSNREVDALLKRLNDAHIHYRLDSIRDGYRLIDVSVPGERWEIEIAEDGECEIEVFKSDGSILDRSALEDLFTRFTG